MRLKNGEVCLGWPLAQHILTQGWFYNDGTLHQAIDMRAAVGTPVLAAEDGTVEIVYLWNGKRTQGDTNSYGNMVKIRHANWNGGTVHTLYAHLNSITVKKGFWQHRQQLWCPLAFRGALEEQAHESSCLAGQRLHEGYG